MKTKQAPVQSYTAFEDELVSKIALSIRNAKLSQRQLELLLAADKLLYKRLISTLRSTAFEMMNLEEEVFVVGPDKARLRVVVFKKKPDGAEITLGDVRQYARDKGFRGATQNEIQQLRKAYPEELGWLQTLLPASDKWPFGRGLAHSRWAGDFDIAYNCLDAHWQSGRKFVFVEQ